MAWSLAELRETSGRTDENKIETGEFSKFLCLEAVYRLSCILEYLRLGLHPSIYNFNNLHLPGCNDYHIGLIGLRPHLFRTYGGERHGHRAHR